MTSYAALMMEHVALQQRHTALAARLAEAELKLTRDVADAQRYREWRRAFREGECGLWNALCDTNSEAEFDGAIDAAIAADSATPRESAP